MTPEDKSKWVFGYGLHWFIDSGADAPNTVGHYVVAPATANPAGALLPLLRDLWDDRGTDPLVAAMVATGDARVLGNVLADTAYCGPAAWQLGIKAMGGNPSWRLHRTNQEGRRIEHGLTTLNARHICECCPPECDTPFPIFKERPSRVDYAQHAAVADASKRWEWKVNKTYADGSMQLLSPHGQAHGATGGCTRCVLPDGTPAADGDGVALARCCQVKSRKVTAHDLRWRQEQTFGSTDWQATFRPRASVEGSYGIVKNRVLFGFGHDYHHYVGLGAENLVTGFAVMAYNLHVVESWLRKAAAGAHKDGVLELPSARPVVTLPEDVRRRVLGLPEKGAPAKTRARGPKGLGLVASTDPPS